MPPIFRERDFDFRQIDEIPDHIEGLPQQSPDAYPKSYRIEEQAAHNKTNILAANIDSHDDAAKLLLARQAVVAARIRNIILRDGSSAVKLEDVQPIIAGIPVQSVNTPKP